MGASHSSSAGFTIIDVTGLARELDVAQLGYQIPLALERHGKRNVIAKHALTLVQR
jgi:hypothetical protein